MSEVYKDHISDQTVGEKDLLRRMAAGDREAWASFVTQYEDSIYAIIHHCLKPTSREEVEDAVQELFASWSNGKHGLFTFEGRNGCSLKSFVTKLASNHALSIRRRRKVFVPLEDPAAPGLDRTESTPEGSTPPVIRKILEDQEIMQKIEQAASNLTSRELLVFNLYYLDEVSRSDIAAFLHTPPNNVDQTLHRVRCKMREILGDQLGG